MSDILQKQARIGWRRFFEGWISIKWTEAQQRYYNLIKSYRMVKRWTTALIKKLWEIAWDLWEHRNGILHETDNVVTSASLCRLDRKVTDTYGKLTNALLPANDRHLLSVSLSRLFQKDFGYKETWLNNALCALRGRCQMLWERRHEQECTLRGMQHTMRQYLRIGLYTGTFACDLNPDFVFIFQMQIEVIQKLVESNCSPNRRR